jgi:AcrR family transcriptional regulator
VPTVTKPDPGRRRRANGNISRLKILAAATEIAAERGYQGTSIGLVTERSGLPASSIYWHFQDKDALIAAVIEQSFDTWLSHADRLSPPSSGESVETRLTAMLAGVVDSLRDSADFLRLGLMLALERRTEEPSARRMFLAVREEALRRTTTSYRVLFPELGEAAAQLLSAMTMAIADGLFVADGIGGDAADPALLAAAVMSAARYLEGRS